MKPGAPPVKTSVRLVVLGTYDHRAGTSSVVGIRPSEQWAPGDLVESRLSLRRKEYAWVLTSPVDSSTEPLPAIQALMALVVAPEAFRRLPPDLEVVLSVGVVAYRERPCLYLPVTVTEWIARLGAALDFDPYDLTDVSVDGS